MLVQSLYILFALTALCKVYIYMRMFVVIGKLSVRELIQYNHSNAYVNKEISDYNSEYNLACGFQLFYH